MDEALEIPVDSQDPKAEPNAEKPAEVLDPIIDSSLVAEPKKRRKKSVENSALPEDNHCPACTKGRNLNEGKHILNTIEHPLPVVPPVQDKIAKRQPRVMPKELKSAASFAEKMLPKKITEKAKAVAEVAKLESEIQELVRVIQALGGQLPVGMPVASNQVPYDLSRMAADNSYMQMPQPARMPQMPPVPMAMGGAIDGAEFTQNESEDQFLAGDGGKWL